MLEQELAKLMVELPNSVHPAIQPRDVAFAMDTLARRGPAGNMTSLARKTAAGIAWERAVIARIERLANVHDDVDLLAERWRPPQAALDLDVIVEDHRKHVIWIIDAKNSDPVPSRPRSAR
jgi:hypothetical protein